MTPTLEDIQSLKDKVETLNKRADKAEGAIEQLVLQLEKELGCREEDAPEAIASLERKEKRLNEELKILHEEFLDKWKDQLDEN